MESIPINQSGDVPCHFGVTRIDGRDVEASDYAGFVFGTFHMSLRRRGLARELRRGGVMVALATPVGDDTLIGWLASNPAQNRIVCAFTKAAYRASPEQRHSGAEDGFRIASSLAIACGIDFGKPVLCSFWSRGAAAIAAKPGNPYNLVYAPEKRSERVHR